MPDISQPALEPVRNDVSKRDHCEALRHNLVGHTLADVERLLILDTLAYCQGNRTHAARLLGISIRTLRNKLNIYVETGIPVPEPGQRPILS